MSKTVDAFIALLRRAVTGTGEENVLADVNCGPLFALSKSHDLAHIVYYELERGGALPPEGELLSKFKKRYGTAIVRHIRRGVVMTQIREILEKARVPFILLKGAALMELYPEPWMRTSSDVDVLVKEEALPKAVKAFSDAGFEKSGESEHEITFTAQNSYHVELHDGLVECDAIPGGVWDHAVPKDGSSFEYLMSDGMFYFYHIAHMAKHFKSGGCGVRSLMDLWLLDHRAEPDRAERDALISEGGFSEFEKYAKALSEAWFSGEKKDPLLEDFENYVLKGGVYGTVRHSVTVRKKKTDNRFVYYAKRLFLPYGTMKYSYPVLVKCPILLPACWVARWFKLLDPSVRKRAANEISVERTVEKEASERTENLMKQLGIW